ncbi:MAG: helix-turn-helix domain-containing protein [Syntrophomonadaceae bacterium]
MQIYTVEQAAKILQVRKGFVYDLIYTGRLKAIRLSERRFRVSEDALRMFIEQEEKETAANISSYTGLHAEV